MKLPITEKPLEDLLLRLEKLNKAIQASSEWWNQIELQSEKYIIEKELKRRNTTGEK
jgi:hypothetical protein